MKVIKDEVFQVNQNNLGLHYDEGVGKVLQENANDAYPQNEVLSSIDEGSQEIKGTSELQHHYASYETFSYTSRDILESILPGLSDEECDKVVHFLFPKGFEDNPGINMRDDI